MFCSNCGTQVSDDSNFCYKCGNKVSVNMKQENVEEEDSDKEEIINKLLRIKMFLQDLCLSTFHMGKKEYTTPEGLEAYSDFLNRILKYTEKNFESNGYVTRKNIEEFANNVDGILYEIFRKYPTIRYSESIQKLEENVWKILGGEFGLSDRGKVIWYNKIFSDADPNGEYYERPEELSLYDCIQKELFSPLDKFRKLYGGSWNAGSGDEIKERTDMLSCPLIVLGAYTNLWSALIQELFRYINSDDEKSKYIMNLLEKYPTDRVMSLDRKIYIKQYKHFGIDSALLGGSLDLKEDEQVLEFEMWDAEEVTDVSFTVINNEFFDEESGQYFPDLFTFELIEIEDKGVWANNRTGLISTIKIKATRNYSDEMLSGLYREIITFCFDTNINSKQYVDVEVI